MFSSINSRDKERDSENPYPAWTCMNEDEKMSSRALDSNAVPVVYSIKASAELNHKIAVALKTSLQKKKIKLLVNEIEAREYFIDKKNYLDKTIEDQTNLLTPFIQTSLMINEIVNLEGEVKNGFIKIKEVGRARKDRYSSLAYANYFANILEENLAKQEDNSDLMDYLFL